MTRWMQFLAVALVVLVTACSSGTYSGAPWGVGSGSTSGIVTDDPSVMPDMSWQTPGQRQSMRAAAPVPAASGTPAKVALLVPLSGKNASLGQSMLNAAQLALGDVGSPNFELVPADTQGTPAGAAAAAAKALQGGATLILGPIFAEDVKMVKPLAATARVPMVAFTTDWTLADSNTYIFGFLPFLQVSRVAQYAETQGIRRLGVVAPATEYADLVVATLPRSGVAPVDTLRYSPGQPDISSLVADFARRQKTEQGLKIDSLLLPLGGESLRSLVALLNQSGIDNRRVRLLGTGLWDDATAQNDPMLSGGWFAAPDPRARADFERRYLQTFGTTPPRLATLAYDSTALGAVLARTDTTGEPYSRDRLTTSRGFAGIDGVFRLRNDGLAERGLAVLEISNGSARVIDPAPTAFGGRNGT